MRSDPKRYTIKSLYGKKLCATVTRQTERQLMVQHTCSGAAKRLLGKDAHLLWMSIHVYAMRYLYNSLHVIISTWYLRKSMETTRLYLIHSNTTAPRTSHEFEKCNGPKWPHSHALQHRLNRFWRCTHCTRCMWRLWPCSGEHENLSLLSHLHKQLIAAITLQLWKTMNMLEYVGNAWKKKYICRYR